MSTINEKVWVFFFFVYLLNMEFSIDTGRQDSLPLELFSKLLSENMD